MRTFRRNSLRSLKLADDDTASFLRVAEVARGMKAAKSKPRAQAAMNRALVGAMMPPYRAIAVGASIAGELDALGKLMSSRMRSDLAVCALLLQAGVRGCLLNVFANVSGMSADSVPRDRVTEALANDREVSRICARLARSLANGLKAECGGSRLKGH
jgi:formiminotetrahydrofolate cyclodeaminase